MSKNKIGVIVGRFQVPELHAGHIELISRVVAAHPKVIIILGCKPGNPDNENPLSFYCRKTMIEKHFPNVWIDCVYDTKSDENWVREVDRTINDYICNEDTGVTVYGSRESFTSCYRQHTKRGYDVVDLMPLESLSGSQVREITAAFPVNTEDFRKGLIYATTNRFPTAYPCVDVVPYYIADDGNETPMIILGKKLNDTKLRFIGGFVSPTDKTLEEAAVRELKEETGLDAIGDVFYLGSSVIDSVYYRNENSIITSLFAVEVNPTQVPVASDDIDSVHPISMLELTPEMLEDSHKPLFRRLWEGIAYQRELAEAYRTATTGVA